MRAVSTKPWEGQDLHAFGKLVDGDTADLAALKAANLVKEDVLRARVFLSGSIDKPIIVKGLTVTKGAREAIEAAGGSVEA